MPVFKASLRRVVVERMDLEVEALTLREAKGKLGLVWAEDLADPRWAREFVVDRFGRQLFWQGEKDPEECLEGRDWMREVRIGPDD